MSAFANVLSGDVSAAPATDWSAIADLKPQLRAHTRIREQSYRDESWWTLEHPDSGAAYRADAAGAAIAQRLTGDFTLEEIADYARSRFALTQDELLELMARLQSADLIQHGTFDDPTLIDRHQRARRTTFGAVKNPLGIRIPLCDPDRWLARSERLTGLMCRPLSLNLIAMLIAFASLLAIQHWPSLVAYSSTRAFELGSLLLLALIYPLVKALHEFAHAALVKYHGGEVHEMGIMLLVFFPVPYVDASASASFERKSARIAVAAAGIVTELALAAIALLVWLNVQDGIVRDAAFSIMLIGSISTLLFNGNPLLRFDGYFVLTDAIEIPNLAPRARAYLFYLIKRYAFGLTDCVSSVTAAGERRWFITYGLAASAYRLLIMGAIALMLITAVPLLGILLAAWLIAMQVIKPLVGGLQYIFLSHETAPVRARAVAVTLGMLALAAYLLAAQPAPSWSRAEGLVRFPETAHVRAAEAGFVREILVTDGQHVVAGQAIAQLEDLTLSAQVDKLRWRLEELQARHAVEWVNSPVDAALAAETLAQSQRELDELLAKQSRLTVNAPASGVIELGAANDWLGRYLDEGASLGHVVAEKAARVIAVVPQSAIDRIRHATSEVTVRTPAAPARSIPFEVASITPAALNELPSAALGSSRGGAIAVDGRNPDGTKALEQVFYIELTPNGGNESLRPGTSAIVRFDHAKESIAVQLSRAARRLFMSELNW